MKKLFLAGAVALCGVMSAQTFGIKAGMNVSSLSDSETKAKVGLNAGVVMNAPLAENFSIQPELLYSMKGAKAKGSSDLSLNLDYISLPVMFQYNATPQFYLEAGPEFSLLVASKVKSGSESADVKELFNSFDFGIGLGAGYYFTPNIGLTARYVAGLTDAAKESEGDALKNNVFQVGLVYMFRK